MRNKTNINVDNNPESFNLTFGIIIDIGTLYY